MSTRSKLVWAALIFCSCLPILAAVNSPLLAWRSPVYIAACFAGIVALVLLLFQALLAQAAVPELSARRSRQAHRWVGLALLVLVLAHLVGLWMTSPPDVIDALLFESPTPFSAWGVVAMWAVFITAFVAVFRRKLRLGVKHWRRLHISLAVVIVIGTVIHALQIEGTMEFWTKWALCLIILAVMANLVFRAKSKL